MNYLLHKCWFPEPGGAIMAACIFAFVGRKSTQRTPKLRQIGNWVALVAGIATVAEHYLLGSDERSPTVFSITLRGIIMSFLCIGPAWIILAFGNQLIH